MPIQRLLAPLAALALTACFDITHEVTISADGSGAYGMSITAEGLFAEGLKNESLIEPSQANSESETIVEGGRIVRRERVRFASLDELALDDERIELVSHGRSFFGFGPTRATFRRTINVDAALEEKEPDPEGQAMVAGMLGDHVYVFTLSLPGDLGEVKPVRIGGIEVVPDIAGNMWSGHTITWRMPLHMLVTQQAIVFEADFSVFGDLETAATRGGSGA